MTLPVKVTILASEWGSSKGGLSTINRELAIQLAKRHEADITFFVPRCSEEDKHAALSHNIRILEATRRPGYEELEWLSFPPEYLQIDIIVGHGVKLGRQAQVIRDAKKCKWVQVVHTDPEELGMFKNYQNPISKGEEKHNVEVELCEMANYVVGVGPKLSEAFRKYLRWCKKDQTVFDLTPGIFDEFASVQQAPDERKHRSILVSGRGDAEDFELKGFDIAGKAVASLPDTHLVFVGAPEGKHEEIKERLTGCGVPASRLRVRGYLKNRDNLKRLFCEVDLVLMPSRTEGFGLTGLEALSAGLPVLVSKNSGFGEALSKVPSGSLSVIDSEDPDVWAEAITSIWGKDRRSRLEEAEVLRDTYGKKYSWAIQIKDVLDKMTNLVLASASAPRGQRSTETQRGSKEKPTADITESHSVPPEILARGNLALEAYNNALREGRTYVRRVPVMLIGQDRSGKTSLKKSLKGQCFNPDEESTVGIDKDPSYFKVTTEIWNPGDKGGAANSDAAISYEYHAAQLIVSNLTEEIQTPTEAPVEKSMCYEITPLSSVHESAENLKPASNEIENPKEITQEQDPSGRLPITDIESSPTREFPSVSSELSDTDFQSSDAPQVDDTSRPMHISPSEEQPKVPDEIAALVEKLLLEVNKGEEEKDIYSVVWDFGGQSVYYVTHPLFLTPRAVYLLVYDLTRNPHDIAKPILMEGMFKKFEDHFNLKTNQDYLDFWMTSVSSLINQDEVRQAHSAPTSDVLPGKLPPVFLVCTHADKPHGGADPFVLAHEIFDSLQRKPYSGQLVEHVFVVDNTKSGSHSECAEVIRLRQDVLAVAKELPQMKEAIPIKWLKYEKALRATAEEEGLKWISLEIAKQIASEVCEINDDQEFLTLLNFLHDQRYLIHFDDSAVLNNLVVLDPQWLVDVFKMVITVRPYDYEEREFKELWRKLETTGILEETLLEHVWGPLLKERETSESLIAIMQKFSLLCPWPSSDTSCRKQYLVPSMLMSYPPQEVINLVASAQIPSLFLKFKSGQIPPSFFPRLVLQFFQWCLEEFPTQVTPRLFHNFARFYISSDTGCSVVLLCHFADVEVIFLGESRDVAESVQPEVNLSAGVSHDTCDVFLACTVRNQLALMVDSMRNEFCWLKNMRCEVSFLCPVCSQGGAVDYCQNHRAKACKQEECLHFFSELELLKSKKIITCTRSAIAQDNRVQIKQFTPWFAFDCGKNEATSEDCDRLLPSTQTLVIQRSHESTLALPGDVVQTLQSPCPPQEVVVQLQEHLQLNQSSLDEPDPETKKWIRCLATEAKHANRLDVVRHLRDISPAGTTGPQLPEQLDIQNIPVGQMMELTMDLSGGDEWRVVAEKLGLTPKQIRYVEKRTLNPCDAALAFISQRCSISVGELYDLLNECGLPVVADNL